MGKQGRRKLITYLPLVCAATFLVVVAPLLLVFWLRSSGIVASVWLGAAIGVVVTFLASYAGGRFWATRTDSRDILFSDLMPWGWVQRWRTERRLAAAADLLGLKTGHPRAVPEGGLTNRQKEDLLTQLSSGLEARDPYTHGHSRRVARHASNIAKRMGLSREEVAKIRAAGAMHDVGKVETPITVLHKEGKLTDDEYAIVKLHPVDGAAMVSTLEDPELTSIVRHHHERLDGTGYPDGLAGEAIPVGARIIAVADTFDAITSTRPYRHANAHKKALDILAAEAGTQLDPDAVRAFCRCYSGRRPLAYWAILVNARPRLAALLGSGLSTAKAGTVANVMATAATTAAVGGAVMGPLVEVPRDSSRALASAAAPDRAASAREGKRQDEPFRAPGTRDDSSTGGDPGGRRSTFRRRPDRSRASSLDSGPVPMGANAPAIPPPAPPAPPAVEEVAADPSPPPARGPAGGQTKSKLSPEPKAKAKVKDRVEARAESKNKPKSKNKLKKNKVKTKKNKTKLKKNKTKTRDQDKLKPKSKDKPKPKPKPKSKDKSKDKPKTEAETKPKPKTKTQDRVRDKAKG